MSDRAAPAPAPRWGSRCLLLLGHPEPFQHRPHTSLAPLLWTPRGGKGSEPRLGPGQMARHSH